MDQSEVRGGGGGGGRLDWRVEFRGADCEAVGVKRCRGRSEETNHTSIAPERRGSTALLHVTAPQTGVCSARSQSGPLTEAANYRLQQGLPALRQCTLSFLIKNINAEGEKKGSITARQRR